MFYYLFFSNLNRRVETVFYYKFDFYEILFTLISTFIKIFIIIYFLNSVKFFQKILNITFLSIHNVLLLHNNKLNITFKSDQINYRDLFLSNINKNSIVNFNEFV